MVFRDCLIDLVKDWVKKKKSPHKKLQKLTFYKSKATHDSKAPPGAVYTQPNVKIQIRAILIH